MFLCQILAVEMSLSWSSQIMLVVQGRRNNPSLTAVVSSAKPSRAPNLGRWSLSWPLGVGVLAHGEKDESQSRRRVLFNALVFCDA